MRWLETLNNNLKKGCRYKWLKSKEGGVYNKIGRIINIERYDSLFVEV